jgi:hypothetical protein
VAVSTRSLNQILGLSKGLLKIQAIMSNEVASEVGKELVDRIRTRVRLGYGVSRDDAPKEKFLKLRPSTIATRLAYKKEGLLSTLTTPAKANMTRFGTMMDSLTYETKPGNVTVLFGSPEEALKAYYNTNLGRPFFYLTDKEVKATTAIIKKAVDAYIDAIAKEL